MSKRIHKTDYCLNCDTYQGKANFCPNCGQPNNSRKPNFWQLIVEAIENLFSFDSRFYHSIPPLLWKPGVMTVEFTRGKRTKYVAPLRLFIMSTILMMFAFSCESRMSKEHWYDVTPPSNNTNGIVDFNLDSSALPQTQLDSLVDAGDLEYNPRNGKYKIPSSSSLRDTMNFSIDQPFFDKMYKYAALHPEVSVDDALSNLEMEPTFTNHLLYNNMHKISHMTGEQFGKYLRGNIIIILLLFIPMMALLLKLFYLNQSIYYVDHFVFALHGQATLFAYITIVEILSTVSTTLSDYQGMLYTLLAIVFGTYILIGVKRFYSESWTVSIFKFIGLNIGFFFMSFIFLILVTTASVILY